MASRDCTLDHALSTLHLDSMQFINLTLSHRLACISASDNPVLPDRSWQSSGSEINITKHNWSLLPLCFTLSLEPTPFISSSTSFWYQFLHFRLTCSPWWIHGGEGGDPTRWFAKLVTRQVLGLQTTTKSTAAGAMPWTPLGSLQRSPGPLAVGRGGVAAPPQKPHPPLQPSSFGPLCLAVPLAPIQSLVIGYSFTYQFFLFWFTTLYIL